MPCGLCGLRLVWLVAWGLRDRWLVCLVACVACGLWLVASGFNKYLSEYGTWIHRLNVDNPMIFELMS